jgi:hypothetical protein
MKVHVYKVKVTSQNWNLAYCQCGDLYGTIVASPEVTQPGDYELRSTLREKDGRIIPMIRVEPLPG